MAAANPRTIVAVMAGSAVILEAWRERVSAILMLWYPGMEGGRALARILTGAVNPSGRLPCTFARRAEDLPEFDKEATSIRYDLWHGYRKLERDGASAAFPFGFGLSYTTFRYSDLRVERKDGVLSASLQVKNTGSAAGDDVVQIYVSAPGKVVERAGRELKAFTRVPLAPGATAPVAFQIPLEDLAYWDDTKGWTVEPGRYTVWAARHAEDAAALTATFTV